MIKHKSITNYLNRFIIITEHQAEEDLHLGHQIGIFFTNKGVIG
jgi:hypothetical protein